ncbi:MAG: DUF2442 domain-containing protein [Betaproteobacteria bacterium]|nr:DUF2442 domain-containing protein [Betaproteobacteria bacterium]
MASKAQIAKAVDARLAAAVAAGAERRKRGDLAVSVRYEPRRKRLHIELASGVAVDVPVIAVEGLAAAKPIVIRRVEIVGKGHGLYWPSLDLDISVPDLVAGCLGTKTWMTALARQAGHATSPAKSASSRANGRKGGRPRKVEVARMSAAVKQITQPTSRSDNPL